MRLIDADKLMEDIIKICKCQPYLEGMQSEIVYIQDVIDEQPTAYNVDKVVEQLDEKSQFARPVGWIYPYEIILTKDVMKIVKAGGLNE